MTRRGSSPVVRGLRIAIALAIVGWLLWRTGVHESVRLLQSANVDLLFAALLAMTGECIGKSLTWRVLLRGLGMRGRYFTPRLLQAYFSGGLLGTVIPSTASTDALRAVLAQRQFGGHFASHAAAVVMLNGMGWIAGCSLGLVGLAVLATRGASPTYDWMAAAFFAAIVGGVAIAYLLLRWKRGAVVLGLRRLRRRRWFAIRHAMRRFVDALLVFERAHVHASRALLLAALGQLCSAATLLALARSIGVEVHYAAWMVVMPLSALFGLVPASVSGFGATQAVHVLLLAQFGVPTAQAFVISALYAITTLTVNVTYGGVAVAFGARRDAPPESPRDELAASPPSTRGPAPAGVAGTRD